ncbi:MAG: Eco57I restriction-modification methylase domain-containing protein [Eubacteriaceae bacterium]
MKYDGLVNTLNQFIKEYNYHNDENISLLFLMKCLFLKFLVNNEIIDFWNNKKFIEKNFTIDTFVSLWVGEKDTINTWEPLVGASLPLGDHIFQWLSDFIDNAPSLKGESPMILGILYEEGIQLNRKKKHGIFYTPENISQVIAEKGMMWGEIDKNDPIPRILDPACGSGSLLIAMYDQLMNRFGRDKNEAEKSDLHKKIVEESLVGIDRDGIACLVTKMILVLKNKFYVYPIGIKKGDLLIEGYEKDNNFDLIIGNPPYVGHKGIEKGYMEELKKRYPEVYQDKGDLSYCFFGCGWERLKQGGSLVYITSRYFLEAYNGKGLRRFLKNHFEVKEIIDFNGLRVIPNVGVDLAIISLRKNEEVKEGHWINVKRFYQKNVKPQNFPCLIEGLRKNIGKENNFYEEYQSNQDDLEEDLWRLYSPMTKQIIEKIENRTPFTLGNVVKSFQGVITGNDKAFIIDEGDNGAVGFEPAFLKPWIKNKDVKKYQISQPKKKIVYTNGISNIENYPEVIKHLEIHHEKLMERRECKSGKLPWYGLQWGRNPEYFTGKKIVFPYKATTNRFAIDEHQCFFSADVYGLMLKKRLYHQISEEFLVILLNSQLYNFYFKAFGKKLGDALYEYYPNTLLKLGIPDIKSENSKLFKGFYAKIEKLVKNNQTEALEIFLKEIDQWFFDYFGLSEEEIEIVIE